nr:transposase [Rhodovulum viride]
MSDAPSGCLVTVRPTLGHRQERDGKHRVCFLCLKRKKVEMLFAHLKRILGLTRLRLRGPNGAKDGFLLTAIAQNLRKLAKLPELDGSWSELAGRVRLRD